MAFAYPAITVNSPPDSVGETRLGRRGIVRHIWTVLVPHDLPSGAASADDGGRTGVEGSVLPSGVSGPRGLIAKSPLLIEGKDSHRRSGGSGSPTLFILTGAATLSSLFV